MTRKTTKIYGFSTVFWSFWVLGPILAHQATKFKLSEWFCFSRHPWGPWGRQSSGMKPKSADSVTVQGCPHISLSLCTYLTAFCIFPFEITFLIHRPINVLQIRASQSDSLHDQSHRKNLLMRDRWKLVTPQSNLKIL